MSDVFVTGGNRGIGLEICRQLSARGDTVFTTCRGNPGELERLPVTCIEGVDVADPNCGNVISAQLGSTGLDAIIHNSGILTRESLEEMDFDRIQAQFTVNTLGPLRVILALLDNIRDGGRIGILSSRMGSIEDNTSGGRYGYRISKAAVNALGKSLSVDLAPREIAVALLHPGMVATEMTGGQGIEPAQAAAGIIAIMDDLDLSKSGGFFHAEGYPLPW